MKPNRQSPFSKKKFIILLSQKSSIPLVYDLSFSLQFVVPDQETYGPHDDVKSKQAMAAIIATSKITAANSKA